MDEVLDVTEAQRLWGTVFMVSFSDGSRSVIDLTTVATGPVFDELARGGRLGDAQVDHDLGTLVWPNGADIDPTTLREASLLSSATSQLERAVASVKGRYVRTGLVTSLSHRRDAGVAAGRIRESVRRVSPRGSLRAEVPVHQGRFANELVVSVASQAPASSIDAELDELERELESRDRRTALV